MSGACVTEVGKVGLYEVAVDVAEHAAVLSWSSALRVPHAELRQAP
jgi:hypothetical protein